MTVCGWFQSEVVNWSVAGETVPSPVFELDRSIVTLSVGWVSSTTLNVAVPLASVVESPEVGDTITAAAAAYDAPSVLPNRASAPARNRAWRREPIAARWREARLRRERSVDRIGLVGPNVSRKRDEPLANQRAGLTPALHTPHP